MVSQICNHPFPLFSFSYQVLLAFRIIHVSGKSFVLLDNNDDNSRKDLIDVGVSAKAEKHELMVGYDI